MRRVVAAALGGVGGPLVGGLATLLCRALNGGRTRRLTAAERDVLAPLLPGLPLGRVRVAESARLPIGPAFAAITLGHTVYVRGRLDERAAGLLAHELAHVAQFERLGWAGMMAAYGRLWLEHGYHAHPLEVEARNVERAALDRMAERRRAARDANG
ncbi:MAG TPA: DUF4157 domain-containing protein [Gemmatimonadales bacterium]|nr:DUF4157 domain-containing protein [Gemmatimonadales bacterium]